MRCSAPPPRRWRSRACALRIRRASAQLDAPSPPPTLPPTLPQCAAGNWIAGGGGAGGTGGMGGMGGMAA